MIKGNGYQVSKILDKFINATFVWWHDSKHTDPYPLTPLISEGDILSNSIYINSVGDPMPLFIIYKDGTCGIEVTKGLHLRTDINLAVGGIGLIPKLLFDGFKESNISSLSYATERIAIAYNEITNKICLISSNKNLTIEEFKYRVSKFGFKLALGLDSGGSAQWSFEESERLTSRYMAGWLYY